MPSSCSWTSPKPMGFRTQTMPGCPPATTWAATSARSSPPCWRCLRESSPSGGARNRDVPRRGAFRPSTAVDPVHPRLLLLRRPLWWLLRARHAPAFGGRPARRAGGSSWVLRELRRLDLLSHPAHRGPGCELAEVLAHADQRHPRRHRTQLQVLVTDVGRRVGAFHHRAFRDGVCPRGV